MTRTQRRSINVLAMVALLGLGGGGGSAQRDRNTAYGLTAGGLAGAVITGGGAVATLGGAALGGLIGLELGRNELEK